MPYAKYIEENIFSKLGMKNSLYGDDVKIVKNRANGYQSGPNGFANAEYLSMKLPYAAGSLIGTVEDLFTWNQALLSGRLVKNETLNKARAGYILKNGKDSHYGYGWIMADVNGSPTVEHSGGINGFITNAIYLPKEDVFVVVYSNCECRPPQEVSRKMAGVAIGKPYNFKSISFDAVKRTEYTGVFESEDGVTRNITIDSGKIYSQRSGGPKFRILPYENDKFFFDESISSLRFSREEGKVNGLYFSNGIEPESFWKKTDKPLPAAKKSIRVNEKTLSTYIGEYELRPNFILTITQQGSQLFAQATGQPKFEVFAESETMFFFKVVDAKIEFKKDADGKIQSLILHQGGREMEGKKIR